MADLCEGPPHQCSLDENGCLRLSAILQAFNAPLSEEQAWALCFQAAKCIVNEWNSDCSACYHFTDNSHVLIHKDGFIHRATVKLSGKDSGKRKLARTEYVLVHDLGVCVFRALDFGFPEDQERQLSPPLEFLIDRMTSTADGAPGDASDGESADASSEHEADEGIERDSGEDDHRIEEEEVAKGMTLAKVMEMCSGHLSCPRQADAHYKAVCRALVAETLELSTFLENISNGPKILLYSAEGEADNQTLEKLKVQDWARLWMQVIQQLRQGVKLKKVDPAQMHPIEYALTPYEMLLDDIRSRRYKLRQVMVNGDIPPRVKKDAHALILEFIRSRPPLVPVSSRKLPPSPPRQLTLYEKLMASIKQEHKLKPTAKETEAIKRKIETSRTKLADTDDTPEPHRRLIKPDLSLLRLPSSFEDDDIDDIPQTPLEEPQSLPHAKRKSNVTPLVRSNSFTDSFSSTSERRHSISVCESPPKTGDQTPQGNLANGHFSALTESSSQQMRSDYWKSSQWQSLECLSLTLEEVVHIRNVLTKAELESLIIDPSLYDDILKGRICFTCKQVRFSFFGPRGIKCKMCERTVCDKCSSKMRIPTEHFARIPVYMLSPTPSPPPEEESSHTFWKFSDVFASSFASEAEQTPKLSRQKTVAESTQTKRRLNFRHSESIHAIANKKSKNSTTAAATTQKRKPPLQRSKTVHHPEDAAAQSKSNARDDKLKGPVVPICRECKVMVCNIIMASQDKVSYDLRLKRNSRTWPQKRASSNNACMTPLSETAPSSPE